MMACMHDWAVKHGLIRPYQPEMPLDDPRREPTDDDFENYFCERCDNMGVVNCYCGGDLCVCRNNGEKDCPDCGNI
jgi:hypothetical protein